jgi:hypothetical protein
MRELECGVRVCALVTLAGALILSTMSGCAPVQPGQEEGDSELVDSASGAVRRTIQLEATLSMAAVVPPGTMLNPAPTGTGLFRFITTSSGGGFGQAVAGLIFEVNYAPNTSITFTGVDVRKGLAGESSDVPVVLGTVSPDEPATFTTDGTGYLKEGFGGLGPPGDSLTRAAREVIADPTSYYFIIRTTTHPDGYLRGQLHYPSGS